MKTVYSSTINPFGGLNFVVEALDKINIGETLNNDLPKLSAQSKYSWRDIIYSYWSVFLSGGDCAEDLANNFHDNLSQVRGLVVPSPDTVLNRLKELSSPLDYCTSKRAKSYYEFSINKGLNNLNVKILKQLFPTSFSENITLDYDNTICYTNKKDAKYTYKKEKGYQPGVGLIGSNVVYVENRNGNCTAHILQDETLERMFLLLRENQIKVANFRADSASYGFEIIQTIDKYTDQFYIRARMSQSIERAIAEISNWEVIGDPKEERFRGEVFFTPFQNAAKRSKKDKNLKKYRLIVSKEKRKDGQVNLFTSEAQFYSSIITNDTEKSMNEIVYFYNQRGAIEREFDVLKNDFNWNKMPYSKIEQNHVFLLITAICKNIYQYLITLFSRKINDLEPHYRLKKFIFRFITVPAKWIKHAKQDILKIYSKRAFKT